MTTGSTQSTTNDILTTLQQQNALNRTYDELPTPTTITGEEVVSENGFIAVDYAGTGGYHTYKKHRHIKGKKDKKIYKIMGYPESNSVYGNFTGSWPAQAAHKALTNLSRRVNLHNSNDLNQIKFWIIDEETGKKYCYIGSRIKLMKPNIIVNKKGEKVKFWYKTTLRKCNFKMNNNKNKRKKSKRNRLKA
jgi:hypothetical protein